MTVRRAKNVDGHPLAADAR